MPLHESAEMYLETIYILLQKNGTVRSIDIAENMGYSKPSVSRAVSLLKKGGYIEMANDGLITLTELGINTAKNIFERHTVLSKFLELIGVDKQTASNDACKIEHIISDDTLKAIKSFIKNSNN